MTHKYTIEGCTLCQKHFKKAKLQTQQDQDKAVSPYVMIHFAWDWLGTSDRKELAEQLEVSPEIKAHAKLRQVACRTSVAELSKPKTTRQ
jgi:hypothetical protein